MNANAKKLNTLLRKVNKKRREYDHVIGSLISELNTVSGLDVVYNDFPGDGLGIGPEGSENYIGIEQVIKVVAQKGTFTEEDISDTYL